MIAILSSAFLIILEEKKEVTLMGAFLLVTFLESLRSNIEVDFLQREENQKPKGKCSKHRKESRNKVLYPQDKHYWNSPLLISWSSDHKQTNSK